MNAQRPRRAEVAARIARLADHLDLEVMRPEPVRERRRLVPVIGRLQENQPRLLAGPIHEPAVDRVFERHPQLEMRIRLERIRMIVEEHHVRTARVNRERVEVARCDRCVGALALNADVIVEQRSELGRGEHGRDLEMSTFRHVNVSSMSPRAHTARNTGISRFKTLSKPTRIRACQATRERPLSPNLPPLSTFISHKGDHSHEHKNDSRRCRAVAVVGCVREEGRAR